MIEYKAIRFTKKSFKDVGEVKHTASLECVNNVLIDTWNRAKTPGIDSVDDEIKERLASSLYDYIYGEYDDLIIEFYKLIQYSRNQITLNTSCSDPYGTDMTILDELAKINEKHMGLRNGFLKPEKPNVKT